ncbi:MAG: hypothetical protein Q4D76_13630 [Oscillospiraceae bacterium]|nr:hypothetical protein [Oscillospiraceae bacterium]
MKKNKTAILAAFLLALSFYGCDKKNVNEETASEIFQEITETENEESTDESVPVSQVSEKTTDYFARLDEPLKNQITLISQKLPELIGEHSFVYLSDLDNNGRTELILSNPDFIIYEVSEDGKSLTQTAAISDDIPVLYPVTDKLMCTEESGRRHYIWRSLRDESDTVVTESEKEYIYENGQLSVRLLRSRQYNFFTGEYSTHTNSDGIIDYAGYASAVSSLYFNSGLNLQQMSIGVLTADDIKNSDEEMLKQFLAELRGYFSVSAPSGKYQYPDLNGIWNRRGGFSSGSDFFNDSTENSFRLSIHDNVYDLTGYDQATGNIQYENIPVSFCAGNSYDNSLWYAELADNGLIKNAKLHLNNDGVLLFEANISSQNGSDIRIEWTFEKEGWEYESAQPVPEESQPVQSSNDETANQETNSSDEITEDDSYELY